MQGEDVPQWEHNLATIARWLMFANLGVSQISPAVIVLVSRRWPLLATLALATLVSSTLAGARYSILFLFFVR